MEHTGARASVYIWFLVDTRTHLLPGPGGLTAFLSLALSRVCISAPPVGVDPELLSGFSREYLYLSPPCVYDSDDPHTPVLNQPGWR